MMIVYPRETPPHIRTARASPQRHTAAGTAAPTTADTENSPTARAFSSQAKVYPQHESVSIGETLATEQAKAAQAFLKSEEKKRQAAQVRYFLEQIAYLRHLLTLKTLTNLEDPYLSYRRPKRSSRRRKRSARQHRCAIYNLLTLEQFTNLGSG